MQAHVAAARFQSHDATHSLNDASKHLASLRDEGADDAALL
jgi:hypothetical protein